MTAQAKHGACIAIALCIASGIAASIQPSLPSLQLIAVLILAAENRGLMIKVVHPPPLGMTESQSEDAAVFGSRKSNPKAGCTL